MISSSIPRAERALHPRTFGRGASLLPGIVGIALTLGAAGCASDSLTAELLRQQNESARIECNCTWEEDGYDSAAECRSESTFSVPAQATACGDRALRADGTGEMVAATECILASGATRLECERAANCDEDAQDQCLADYIAVFSNCPQPSSEAQAAYQAALQECISGAGGDGPRVNGCPEDDLGSATGASVATGSTANGDNDLGGSCGGQSSNDTVFSWSAPQTGTVTIDTFGSQYDTVLYVASGTCEAPVEVECNDDEGTDLQSEVVVDVTAGETLLIVVDGFGRDDGRFVLNINY